jgi:hypothetical protein
VQAWLLLLLIPISFDKRQTFKERLRQVREHVDLFARSFSMRDLGGRRAVVILLVAGSFLGMNARVRLVDPHFLVNIVLVLSALAAALERPHRASIDRPDAAART